jgi:hypothetical protein
MPTTSLATQLGRRLRLVLRREPESLSVSPLVVSGPETQRQVEFVAYAEDCLLSGFVRLAADRLTDLLNDHDEVELIDVFVQDLAAGPGRQVAEIMVRREELLMVQAVNPRGHRGRRTKTRQFPVAMQIGPYHVRGYIHALPGSDPISGFRRRRPMVPITDAWIEYVVGKTRQRRRVGTLIVNRELVDWIVEAIDDEVEMPDIPLSTYPKGPLLKDFTGELHVD